MTNIHKKMFTPATLAFIGGLIALTLTYLAALKQEKDNESEQKRLSDENKSVNKKLEETNYYLTGGDGYCYAELVMGNGKNEVQITIQQRGKFPLQAVEIYIINTDYACAGPEILKVQPADYESIPYSFGPSNMITDGRKYLGAIETVNKPKKQFNLRFTSNNREWFQRIILCRKDKSSLYNWATQVYKMEKNQEIILDQGTNYTMSRDFVPGKIYWQMIPDGEAQQIILNNLWDGFPLTNGTNSPWDTKCKAHFTGEIIMAWHKG